MRVAAIPALVGVGVCPVFPGQEVFLRGCFVGASLTDWLDGYLARRWKVTTSFGAFLDPVADKLMVAAALILISVRFAASANVSVAVATSSIVIIVREIAVSAIREWMAGLGMRDQVKVGFAGKVKTATQMVALSVLLGVTNPLSVMGRIGIAALVVSAVLAVQSAVGYVQAAAPTFRDSG